MQNPWRPEDLHSPYPVLRWRHPSPSAGRRDTLAGTKTSRRQVRSTTSGLFCPILLRCFSSWAARARRGARGRSRAGKRGRAGAGVREEQEEKREKERERERERSPLTSFPDLHPLPAVLICNHYLPLISATPTCSCFYRSSPPLPFLLPRPSLFLRARGPHTKKTPQNILKKT